MQEPSVIQLQSAPPSLDGLDFAKASLADSDDYHGKLKKWQDRILRVQQAYFHQRRKSIVVLEGWDASGKGGAIRRLTEKLDPRGFDVHPIAAPSAEEHARHYLYRFQTRLPAAGTMAVFDRSWYGRVLVERIEGLASESEWQRAYREINEFERQQMDDGTRIIKIFLHITPEEQLKRFTERLHNPLKQWKLTHEDIRNRDKWGSYVVAVNDMLRETSTIAAPWVVIPANRKWYTRVEVLKTIAKALEQGVDLTPPPLDMSLIKLAEEQLGIKRT